MAEFEKDEIKNIGTVVLFYTSSLILVGLMVGLFLFVGKAHGSEVNAVTFSVGKIYNKRDYYLTDYTILREGRSYESQGERWNHQMDLHTDITIFDLGTTWSGTKKGEMFWTQDIVGESTTTQYRRIHWEFEWGFNVWEKFDIFHHHRSEHALDRAVETTASDAYLGSDRSRGYPLLDVYGIRFCFMGKRCGR